MGRKGIKGKNVAEVSKKAGEMWKSLSADKKKAYEDRAVKAKAEYVAYIAKVKDSEGFKAYKDELAVARKKRLKRSVKSAMRKVPMDSSLKRPLSGYMLWFKDTRKSIKGKNIAEVSKKAGEMWKSLPADKKKIYEDRASKAKAEYTAYIGKVKGTEAFTAYKGELAAKRMKKLKRSVKSAMHKVPMDKSLKRPMSGYMLWLKDTRKTIKGKNVAEVSKKAGEMWKGLPA